MPLQACPDCEHECSTSAAACPQCGYPFKKQSFAIPSASVPKSSTGDKCPYCHADSVRPVQGVYGAETACLILLSLLGLLPGILYYFDITRYPMCGNCRKRIKRPVGGWSVSRET